jgi:hypothetical protein
VHNNRNALLALAVIGGYFLWRNRFAIQTKLESIGVKTPLLSGSVEETAKSVASKVSGQMEKGARIAEDLIHRKTG